MSTLIREEESGSYNDDVVLVDPHGLDLASEDEDQLMIDCEEEEDDEDGYDPLSLVSVGLGEDEDDDMDEEDYDELSPEAYSNHNNNCTFCNETFTNRRLLNSHILTAHQKDCSVACQYCGQVLSDGDTYRRHLSNVHQVSFPKEMSAIQLSLLLLPYTMSA